MRKPAFKKRSRALRLASAVTGRARSNRAVEPPLPPRGGASAPLRHRDSLRPLRSRPGTMRPRDAGRSRSRPDDPRRTRRGSAEPRRSPSRTVCSPARGSYSPNARCPSDRRKLSIARTLLEDRDLHEREGSGLARRAAEGPARGNSITITAITAITATTRRRAAVERTAAGVRGSSLRLAHQAVFVDAREIAARQDPPSSRPRDTTGRRPTPFARHEIAGLS